jgi:undecaprenyl-diphosphatase
MTLIQFFQVIVLAIVQGLAELLPVSSSAHVTVAAKLMHSELLDKQKVFEWTFLLVMLHAGTMFSVLIYFWSRWKKLWNQIPSLVIATVATAAIGFPLKHIIEKYFLNADASAPPQEIEALFQNLPLMACALAIVGVLIVIAGFKDDRAPGTIEKISPLSSAIIGAVQGLALPFRGFSRSGSTISTGMLMNIARIRAEEFSFALAVILTPAIIGREVLMLIKQHAQAAGETALVSASAASAAGTAASKLANHLSLGQLLLPGLIGMVASFLAGLVALKWLSNWLEHGRWKFFGIYCLVAAAVVVGVHVATRAS